MKLWAKLLVPVLMLGLVGIADAKGKGKHSKPLSGKIVSIAADGKSFSLQPKGKKGAVADPITITMDPATTTVEVNGAAGKTTDLTTGEKVSVTGGTGGSAATEIKATTKGKHKKKK